MPPTSRTASPPAASNTALRPAAPVHPNELPRNVRPGISFTGSPSLDKKYQQQQEKLRVRQEQERQNLQHKQERQHQALAQARADEGRRRQLEQSHQQETQRLGQRHAVEQQKLLDRQKQTNRAAPR